MDVIYGFTSLHNFLLYMGYISIAMIFLIIKTFSSCDESDTYFKFDNRVSIKLSHSALDLYTVI